jgi:ABC-type nitrate/sulfonate/bicarbonate transport system ATPase subunit
MGGGPEEVELACETLAQVGLSGLKRACPGQLSVGVRRKAALVLTFAMSSIILLMGEPFVSLDEPGAEKLGPLLVTLRANHLTTVLFVARHLREPLCLGDRLILVSPVPARAI